jgi:hypothetical protein
MGFRTRLPRGREAFWRRGTRCLVIALVANGVPGAGARMTAKPQLTRTVLPNSQRSRKSFAPSWDDIANTRFDDCRWTKRHRPCRGGEAHPIGGSFALHWLCYGTPLTGCSVSQHFCDGSHWSTHKTMAAPNCSRLKAPAHFTKSGAASSLTE